MANAIDMTKRTITGAADGPHLLITGGTHGDEYESMAAIRRLMRDLSPAAIRGRVTFVPVINEAAFWNGQRTAEDGLDLARICPGKPDGSVSDRTAVAISELIRSVDYYIDLHSGGHQLDVLPWSGYGLHKDGQVLDAQRRMARAFNLPFIWGTAGNLDGRTLSIARDAKVPAIYAEYLGGGRLSADGARDYYQGCLNVMAELDMIDQPAQPSRVTLYIEDARPGSGHLQINFPSPNDGFFESSVALGQYVHPGTTIGTVSDFLGDRVDVIQAVHGGIVICLRVFNRVFKDDCLGVVLNGEDMSERMVRG